MLELKSRDSNIIKAISIIVIVLHNFVHLTNPIRENEYVLDPDRIYRLFEHLMDQPAGILTYVFSYFGWYFVIPFVFISGYGLAKKYDGKKEGLVNISAAAVFKTAVLLAIGALYIWVTGYASLEDSLMIFYHKLATIDNFTSKRVFSGVGPWWYFSLIIQLYLIFPVLYKVVARRRTGVFFVLVLAYFVVYLLYFFVPKLNVFSTAFGQIPVFVMGIFLAKHEIGFGRRSLVIVAVVCLVVFWLSQFFQIFFPFTYLAFVGLFLIAYQGVKGLLDHEVIVLIGKISAFVFILNGPIRTQTMNLIGAGSGQYPNLHELFVFGMSVMHLLAVLAVSTMFYLGLNDIMRGASARFSRALDGSARGG